MSEVVVNGVGFGGSLAQFMDCGEIKPGDSPSYEMCKVIFEYHPLGAKLVEAPITLAQSQPRKISVTKGPEDRVKKAFEDEWAAINADEHILNVFRQARMYGIASLALLERGKDSGSELDVERLGRADISFSVFDPLNTAGSLVLNQNPNAMDFQKTFGNIAVQGQIYHRSRVVIILNEDPIYLGYTTSAYGYVGRSVYQRTLYALQSFLLTMKADAMVARKAGIIVAAIQQVGSVVDWAQQVFAGIKRNVVKEAQTDNVINITPAERVEAIDLTNVNDALEQSRKNILNNIASGAGMPAILVNEETFAEGFGEGTEDARHVALFIENFRKKLRPAYAFFDKIVQYRAWNEDFFKALQQDFPSEYSGRTYEDVFYEWVESFEASWPSLLTEPESEKAKADDVKLKALIATVEVLLPEVDPDNKATIVQWMADNLNAMETMFSSPLVLDYEALAEYEPPVPMQEPKPEGPFSNKDSAGSVAELVKLAGRVR